MTPPPDPSAAGNPGATITDWDLVREALLRKDLGQGLYDEGAAVMVSTYLTLGGRRDPDRPPVSDDSTSRTHFSFYPVLFGVGQTDVGEEVPT